MPTYLILNTAALIAFVVCTIVMIAYWRRRLRRTEDEVERIKRQLDENRADLEAEHRRAEWRERKWRKFGGEWE